MTLEYGFGHLFVADAGRFFGVLVSDPQRRAAALRKWALQPGMNALVSRATATRERQIEDAKLTEGFGAPAASLQCLVHCWLTVPHRGFLQFLLGRKVLLMHDFTV